MTHWRSESRAKDTLLEFPHNKPLNYRKSNFTLKFRPVTVTRCDQLDMVEDTGGAMTTFSDMSMMGHEQVVFCRNDDVGLRAIIAIHDTTLGPALGGLRLYNYANESEVQSWFKVFTTRTLYIS